MKTTQRRFSSTYALAELPWFAVKEGRLVLADPSVGPIIDIHTHLALTYGRRRSSVDLTAAPRPTEHYLPLSSPLDLDVYQNVNFSPVNLKQLKADLTLGSMRSGGLRATHTAPNLEREMAELGLSRAVLLPVELPVLSSNAAAYLEVARTRSRLLSMGGVHPHDRRAVEKLCEQQRRGACGVKLHPAVQLVAPDHPKALALYPICADLGLPVLWHCGPVGIELAISRPFCQLKNYWRAIHDNPRTTFILGHSGALQMSQALSLCRTYPNVYLELACQGLANVERIIAEAPIERVMYGSDWPVYHQSIGIAKVLLATEGKPTERRLVLHDNAARLLGLKSPEPKETGETPTAA